MFYVWDGNHRFSAWWRKINNDHSDEPRWHFSVICIVLDSRGRIGPLLIAMNDVNWSTQNDHVKTSLRARLTRMRYFGALALEDFRHLLTSSEFKSYEKVKKGKPTWFPLTVDVFISFLYWADISRACDEAVNEYNERTPEMDRIATAVWGVMQLASEKAIKTIKQKDFHKSTCTTVHLANQR